MQTPQRVTLEESSGMRMTWIVEHCRDQRGFQVCRKCSAKCGDRRRVYVRARSGVR
jgi:hypothetical protein